MEGERATELRNYLKEWETSFANANGRRPGREDIKANPEIAAKYKEYTKIRPPPPSKQPSKTDDIPATPQKQSSSLLAQATPTRPRDTIPHGYTPTKQLRTPSKSFTTPIKTPSRLPTPSDYDSPMSVHKLRLGRDHRTIDPTPQRAGRVLGLFESHLSPSKPPSKLTTIPESPSGPKPTLQAPTLAPNLSPSKSTLTSPTRTLLFSTPRKRKHPSDLNTPAGSPLKRYTTLETPACLRRASNPTLDSSPPPPFLLRKQHTKPLTLLASELRALASSSDDEFSDEEAVLREMEGLPPVQKPDAGPLDFKAILARKASKLNLEKPTAGDEGGEVDIGEEDDEEDVEGVEGLGNKDRFGNDRKVWKKKGLKRQTRRVKMKPSIVAPLKPNQPAPTSDDEAEDQDKPAKDKTEGGEADGDGEHHDNSDYEPNDDDDDGEAAPKKRKSAAKQKEKEEKKEEPKKGRKVKESAHMNYVKLKIKSRGGGGRGRGGGRFGRRR